MLTVQITNRPNPIPQPNIDIYFKSGLKYPDLGRERLVVIGQKLC